MALIKCPECGHQVSDRAPTCPNCGCPIESSNKKEQSIFHLGRKVKDNDPSWIQALRSKGKGKKKKILIVALILLLVSAIFFPLSAALDTNVACLVIGCLSISFSFLFLLLGLILSIKPLYVVDSYNGFFIAIHSYGHNEVYIDGKEVLYEGHYHTEISGDEDGTTSRQVLDRATFILPDETRCQIIIAKGRYTFKYDPKGTYSDVVQNVVNNNTTVVKKGKQPERSDMEKILIKNAKIDALASIDPNNVNKAKDQIDIVKKLDDLD